MLPVIAAVNIHKTFLALENIFLSTTKCILLHFQMHSTAFRMKIVIISRFWLTISAILDSEKATRVASGHPG